MLANRTVTIYRALLISDPDWGDSYDWGQKWAVYSGPASVQPFKGDGTTTDAETASQWQYVLIPKIVDVQLTDRWYLNPDDVTYWEVNLRPELWYQGRLAFTKVVVRQTTG